MKHNCKTCGISNAGICNTCECNKPSNWTPKAERNYSFLDGCYECKTKDKTIEILEESNEELHLEVEFYRKLLYGSGELIKNAKLV